MAFNQEKLMISHGRYALATGLFAAALSCIIAATQADRTINSSSFGGADVNLITGGETSPHVLQDEGAVWGHGNTVVAVYQDASGAPSSYCGVSVSTDGGATFTRLPYKFNTGGNCYGEPSVFYSVHAAKWFASFLFTGCGAPGNGDAGVGQWESPDGISWSNSGCVALGGSGGNGLDLPSTWVDNNPASPFYGRQYAFFNNFDVGGGAPQITYSTDDGVTWSAPVSLFPSFRRAVKITGSLGADGTVFAQVMDEGGGGLNGPRQNFIHRSTNGGVNWAGGIVQGATFLGPGRVNCGDNTYYPCIYTSPGNGYWKDMGFGQPAVGPNGVVHYAYSGRTTSPADPGNIYYVRSTDNGGTWSVPVQLNTDTTTRAQWSPSVSVNAHGVVFVSWYDERNTTDDSLQRYGRTSLDNGVSWDADAPLSDVIFPKPLQSDTSINPSLVGLYNNASFSNDNYGLETYHVWTDGRVLINGLPQQDVFFHKVSFPPLLLTVTTVADHDDGACTPSDCTLREAINGANISSTGGFINFAAGVTGTIQLTAPLPALSNNITVQGPGANVLAVRRNTGGAYRIFTVNPLAIVSFSGLTITNGDASGQLPEDGGGIFNDRAAVTVNGCVISGNTGFPGGGIYNRGSAAAASLTMTNSTVSGNVASGGQSDGGGMYNEGLIGGRVTATLTNCTISGNTATDANAAGILNWGQGGAAVTTLTNCTVNSNAIFNRYGTLFLANTLLNAGTGGPTLANTSGTITSLGHNLSSDAAGGFLNNASDKPSTNPQLDPAGLNSNGGPTKTIALLSNSPAINMGDDTLAPPTDQRSFARAGVSDIGAFEFGGTIALAGVASVKAHGSAGTFAIPLPLSGTAGVECRSGGASNAHTIVFTFANPLTSVAGATVSSGTGTISSASIGGDAHQYTVNLTGVSNAQTITITLTNVNDSFGAHSDALSVSMGLLLGDSNGDGFVNSGDAIQSRNRSGQAVDATNFRSDLNLDGSINSGDALTIRNRSGTSLNRGSAR